MTVFIFPAHIWITQFSTRFNNMRQIKSTDKVLEMPLFKSRMAILWIPTLILLNQGQKRRFIQQELWQRCNLYKTHRRSSTDPLRLKGQFLKIKGITWIQPLFEIGKQDPVNSIKLSSIIKISSMRKATGLILQINIKYQMTLNSWQELGWGLNHSNKEWIFQKIRNNPILIPLLMKILNKSKCKLSSWRTEAKWLTTLINKMKVSQCLSKL